MPRGKYKRHRKAAKKRSTKRATRRDSHDTDTFTPVIVRSRRKNGLDPASKLIAQASIDNDLRQVANLLTAMESQAGRSSDALLEAGARNASTFLSRARDNLTALLRD